MDPEVARVLRQATEVYHGAKGFRFEYEQRLPNKKNRLDERGMFAFQGPNLLRVSAEKINGSKKYSTLSINNNSHNYISRSLTGQTSEYEITDALEGYDQLKQTDLGWAVSDWIYPLAAAEPMVDVDEGKIVREGLYEIYYLNPRLIDGEMVEGVQIRELGDIKQMDVWKEDIGWFGVKDHLLRRAQHREEDLDAKLLYSIRLFNIAINPKFPSDTFKFVPLRGAKNLGARR